MDLTMQLRYIKIEWATWKNMAAILIGTLSYGSVGHLVVLIVNRQSSVSLWFFCPLSLKCYHFSLLQFCIAKRSLPIQQLWVLLSFVCITPEDRLLALMEQISIESYNMANQISFFLFLTSWSPAVREGWMMEAWALGEHHRKTC